MRLAIGMGALWGLVGCASPAEQAPPPVILVPTEVHAEGTEAAPPPRAEPIPPPREDPYAYFVGRWQGVVNEKLTTELVVTEGGKFHVHLPPHPHRPVCDLWGRMRVSPEVVYLDVEQSTCEAESVGTTLERVIVSKTPEQLVVQSRDGSMVVRYTRRAE